MKTNHFCPLCKKDPEKTMKGISGYFYCSHCKLGWKMKFPKPDYGKEYYEGKSSIISILFSPIGNMFYGLRSRYPKKNNVKLWIDVGAGEGSYLQSVNAKRKIGVDVSSVGRKFMEKRGIETMTEKEFIKKKNLNADIISFWHVLEHVDQPWRYLAAAKRNIKKSGKIIIGVPNIDSMEFRLFKKFWFHLVPNHHLWHFSPFSMSSFLHKEMLLAEKIDYWSPEHHLTGVLQSFINWSSKSDSVLHRLIRRREKIETVSLNDIFWSVFWLTVGSPIVLCFWALESLLKKSGTMVVVAKRNTSEKPLSKV